MIRRGPAGQRAAAVPAVGLFGGLGSGNIGNDASMEAVLRYFRADHPEAVLDAMCAGPEWVTERYGVAAIPARWYQRHERQASGAAAIVLKALGKGADAFRIASWVRRHDVVIVPGMGVLETGIPVRPWQFPYELFLLCAAGRISRTPVALVSVGASVISKRLTRWLLVGAARLASYRSYRDTLSQDVLRLQGLDTEHDQVFSDLAFGLPAPPCSPGDVRTVGVGVMDYYGSEDDDRSQAARIHASYVAKMSAFVSWLVDNGRRVLLFVGDTNGSDEASIGEILTDLRARRPGLDPAQVTTAPVSSTFGELMSAMAPVGMVVATRYHNVICALRLGKPTISIGYSEKNDALMADMGLSEFCQSVSSLDVGRLIEQFTALESRAAQLRQTVADRSAAHELLVERQFSHLSDMLAGTAPPGAALHASAPHTAHYS